MRTAILTVLTLLAFAANSILCRLALGTHTIDAASFALLRLACGAAALAVVMHRGLRPLAGSWLSAAALFLYAVPFSFAYMTLSAGTGALILFAAVQATMIGIGLRDGERPHSLEWLGLVIAVAGLVVLVAPGLRAPSMIGSSLMAIAGIAWGAYSLRGRGAQRPVAETAGNFVRATPMVLAVALLVRVVPPGASSGWGGALAAHASGRGIALAVLSGAITSGLGYVLWYAALRGLTATRAATVQLAVPVIAAAGGVALLGERVTVRLLVAAGMILGGVIIALQGRAPRRHGDVLTAEVLAEDGAP